ncbi:MAG: hydroxymethylglutaryl-CoA lyase [Acidobacteriaceae bacterium]|nr:hydroxymethylglutaryl-CoA lyase [Acidobacteriaceae bacterium]
MRFPDSVRIVEVGPRDGLQNEAAAVSVGARISLIEALAEAGLVAIESGSFVSPRWVPQMAATPDVFSGLRRLPGVSYSTLVPNLKGLDAALACGVREIAVFASASESFSQHNINCSISESLVRIQAVTQAAMTRGLRVRAYVSCVLGCPYEGEIGFDAIVRVAQTLYEMGCYEISLGDTIGVGTPLKARRLLETICARVPMQAVAVHFHDTWGQALANILASLEVGVSVVDSSVSGLGGCPHAPGAAGNVATEDVLYMLHGMGIHTGVILEKVAAAGIMICRQLGRAPASKAALALSSRSCLPSEANAVHE